jgi:hypothetical protein
MGVIRKKTATRGGEGGVKYVCDVCSADITSTVCKPAPVLAFKLVLSFLNSLSCLRPLVHDAIADLV